MLDRETTLLHFQIANRAHKMGILQVAPLTLLVDLEAASIHFNLDCKRLMEADDSNFAHDVCGIQANINRKETNLMTTPPTVVFENNFVPRYARES